jgi:ADP-ribose pyrophosphatase YjhB (NUDIX family)
MYSLKSCPFCSTKLGTLAIGGRDRIACVTCDFVHWDNPKPVTATLVPLNEGLVLVRRNCEPFIDDWCLPGGFIEARESPDEAAVREVFEETGLEVTIKKLLDAFSPGRGINVIILFYLADTVKGSMCAGDDASEVGIFKKSELPNNICFDLHRRMIRKFFEGNGSFK